MFRKATLTILFLGLLNPLYAQVPLPDSTSRPGPSLDSLESKEKIEFIREDRFQERLLGFFSNRQAITQDEMDYSIIRSWGDILSLRPGIETINYSGIGQPQILVINGSTQQVGVVANDFQYVNHSFRFPYVSGLDLGNFPLENTEKIQLVGPGISTVFGEDLALGALLMKSKEPCGKSAFSRALHQKAPDGFDRTQLELGKNLSSRGKIYFTAGFEGYDGYLLNHDSESMRLTFWGQYILRKDLNMGIDFSTVRGKRGLPYTENLNLKSITEYGDDWRAGLKLVHNSSQNQLTHLKLFFCRMKQRFNDSKFSVFREDVEEILSLAAEHQLIRRQKHNLSLKGNWTYDRLDEKSSLDLLENKSLSLVDLFESNESVKFLFCVKANEATRFDFCLSPMLGVSYQINGDSKLFFVLGRFCGFPTIRDLYLDSSSYDLSAFFGHDALVTKGNNSLKAQKSLVANLGYSLSKNSRQFDLNVYRMRLENQVKWENQDQASFWGTWTPLNQDLSLYGVNSDFTLCAGRDMKLFISYVFQKAEDPHAGFLRSFVPEHSLFCYLEYGIRLFKDEARLSARVENSFVTDYYFVTREKEEKQGNMDVVDLRFTYTLLDFTCYYVIENLNDKTYRTYLDYPAPRRTHWWGFSWQFFD